MKGKIALVVAAAVIAAVVGSGSWLLSRKQARARSVSGTVEVDIIRVASRYGGRIRKLHAREGGTLRAGQLIAELDAAELRARRDHAAALLEELQRGARAEEIAAAKHEWESLLEELKLAQLEAARVGRLFEEKTANESERDRAVAQVRVLEHRAAAAKERHDLLASGTRPERIAQAKAQLAEVEAQLRETQIMAPDPGGGGATALVLEVLHARVGDVLRPNQDVATVLVAQRPWVRVFVPEPWLARIREGETVKVRLESSPDQEFDGVIEQIHRQAEFTPRNVQTTEERIRQVFGVKVRLPGNSPLRAGMSVKVFFPDEPEQPR
jgi:HlyD family secretion protein